ncbi:conserved hypothetical protein [Thiobacillus denitrificans ATCC 25259]|uniref:SPOR domain-containing protein n=1 Tax=Thiobacillus denitrificans (strain ATCC 25259 / T1) TaxID=292415 RepID=Q3SHM3_THIDA|nr:SPOR domain-containing protein [Thiobacillus denitrificans]AAZ97863.1 conserved hypothetical protein [Thiobacillus denitrificans ATCC 25259]
MPPPSSSENELRRRARRRLIGAVALTLVAVIALPLLLEDEPPPASSLAVRMATPLPDSETSAQPAPAVDPPAQTRGTEQAEPSTPARADPDPALPASKPQSAAPEVHPAAPTAKPKAPAQTAVAKPAPAPPPQKTPTSTTAAAEVFVVQLAALADVEKAGALKARATLAGLPAYTDTVGTLTRVRVGPYASREAAANAAQTLAQNGMKGQVLAK